MFAFVTISEPISNQYEKVNHQSPAVVLDMTQNDICFCSSIFEIYLISQNKDLHMVFFFQIKIFLIGYSITSFKSIRKLKPL